MSRIELIRGATTRRVGSGGPGPPQERSLQGLEDTAGARTPINRLAWRWRGRSSCSGHRLSNGAASPYISSQIMASIGAIPLHSAVVPGGPRLEGAALFMRDINNKLRLHFGLRWTRACCPSSWRCPVSSRKANSINMSLECALAAQTWSGYRI